MRADIGFFEAMRPDDEVVQSLCAEARRLRRGLDELRSAADQADAEYRAEIATLRLTDAEREAVERAIATLDGWQATGGYHSAIDDDAATLRGLLERLK